jgi:hypothetical protein
MVWLALNNVLSVLTMNRPSMIGLDCIAFNLTFFMHRDFFFQVPPDILVTKVWKDYMPRWLPHNYWPRQTSLLTISRKLDSPPHPPTPLFQTLIYFLWISMEMWAGMGQLLSKCSWLLSDYSLKICSQLFSDYIFIKCSQLLPDYFLKVVGLLCNYFF